MDSTIFRVSSSPHQSSPAEMIKSRSLLQQLLCLTFELLFFLESLSNDLNQLVLAGFTSAGVALLLVLRKTTGLERGVDNLRLIAIS